ncbi:MAG TPA: hypothetical protein DCQ29_05495 [Chitinophagaceae bacterium]|nr:hypothetical protein [Chitinophagaceae bacterium]
MKQNKDIQTPYTHTDISRYWNGNMPAHERYALERAALTDPLLADALEAYQHTTSTQIQPALNNLEQQLLAIAQESEQAPVLSIPNLRKSWYWLAGAACVGAIALVSVIGYWEENTTIHQQLANNTPKTTTNNKTTVPNNVATTSPTAVNEKNNLTVNDDANKKEQPALDNSKQTVAIMPPANTNFSTDTTVPVTIVAATSTTAATAEAKASTAEADNVLTARKTSIASNHAGYGNAVTNSNNNFITTERNFLQAPTAQAKNNNIANFESLQVEEIQLGRSKLPNDTSQATPIGGWAAFYKYVQQQKLEVLVDSIGDFAHNDKDITIIFDVDKQGNPVNIKPLITGETNLAQKAIDIIQNGPRWNAEKKRKVKLVITF